MLAHWSTQILVFAAVLLGLAAACSTPCEELSRVVCRCERTEIEQQACIQRIDSVAAATETKDPEEECCDRLLDTCTCGKLAAGNLAACGIAQERDPSQKSECLIPESYSPDGL